MKTYRFLPILLIACLTLVGCTPKIDFDIRGKWEYTMTAVDGNTYDTGTITFNGEPAKGTYHEVNIYQVNYSGEYSMNGAVLNLTGSETWKGEFVGTNSIKGIWRHNDGVSGTFIALRK